MPPVISPHHSQEIYDVAVIGGGPAGMMAAGRAAERGLKVILLEKNKTLGKKLLITGGGRCNVTNAEFDTRTLLSKFKENDKFLFSAFSQWSVKESLDFFNSRERLSAGIHVTKIHVFFLNLFFKPRIIRACHCCRSRSRTDLQAPFGRRSIRLNFNPLSRKSFCRFVRNIVRDRLQGCLTIRQRALADVHNSRNFRHPVSNSSCS
jgi:hypothetical protein